MKYTGELWGPLIRVPFMRQLKENSMKANVYSGNGYAGITSKNLTAYYGHECVDEAGQWCFEAKFSGTVIKIPFAKLGYDNRTDVMGCLLKGLAWVMEKYKLTL